MRIFFATKSSSFLLIYVVFRSGACYATLELACFVSIHKLLNLTVFLQFLIANVLTKQGPHAHGLVYKAKL